MRKIEINPPDPQVVQQIRQKTGCGQAVATILANRQIVSEPDLDLFFNSSLNRMSPPFRLKDMDKAVERLHRAIVKQEKILCFVDYDADGVTSGTVLLEGLQALGARVQHYIPHRHTEGYGLSVAHIGDVALSNQIDLIVTADCGSKAADAVESAKNHGIDVIVTDHHEVRLSELPRAVAVVNPKREDDESGLEYLAGVGVAFYLIVCLRAYLRDQGYFKNGRPEPNLKALTDVVAIGTVADVVPLIKDNRIIVDAGLSVIRAKNNRIGLNSLLKIAKIDPEKINSTDIAYKLGPRINAASRMAHADIALQLLTCSDPQQATQLAEKIDLLNCERKDAERQILEEIDRYLQANPQELERSALVLHHENWPTGILGIAAGRLAEAYWRPVVLISTDGGHGKGSARSIPGFDIHGALAKVSHTLDGFGGHEQAAGITIGTHKLSLFKEAFEKAAAPVLQELSEPRTVVDYEIGFEEIDESLMDEIERLQPFGASNPEPVFMAKNIRTSGAKVLCGAHRRMFLEQPASCSDRTFAAIHFNVEDPDGPLPDNLRQVVFKLTWNHWNGRKTLQVQMIDAA